MRLSPKEPRQRARQPARSGKTQVNTYYRSTGDSAPSPFQKKAPKKSIRRYLFGVLDIVLIALIFIGILYSMVIKPDPKLIVNSQAFHSQAEYRAYAKQLFSQLKNRNKVTYDGQEITLAMKKKFPEIKSIDTELPLFSEKPALRIVVAKPSLKVQNNGISYVVDSQGVVVATANRIPGAKQLPLVVDESGYGAQVGRPLLSGTAVDFINTVLAQAKSAKVPVSLLTLPPVAQEIDLKTTDQPYYVKFYLGGDALTQAGQYLAARAHFIQTSQAPSQYLDVRVSGKIFYK
jgi:cell division septal protein FtsQ